MKSDTPAKDKRDDSPPDKVMHVCTYTGVYVCVQTVVPGPPREIGSRTPVDTKSSGSRVACVTVQNNAHTPHPWESAVFGNRRSVESAGTKPSPPQGHVTWGRDSAAKGQEALWGRRPLGPLGLMDLLESWVVSDSPHWACGCPSPPVLGTHT